MNAGADEPPARTQGTQGCGNEAADWRKDDGSIERFRRLLIGSTRPHCTQLAREGLARLIRGTRECENTAALGNWNPASAVLLSDTSGYPTWRGAISLPAQQTVEWKCIIRSESDPSQVKSWQPGANNSVTSAAGASTSGSF